jgi:hypothetical protein
VGQDSIVEDLFQDELRQPSSAIAYRISRALAQGRPESAILEARNEAFDLLEYAAAGHCTAELAAGVHSQIETQWKGPGRGLQRQAANAWFDVRWQDHELEVVTASWTETFQPVHWQWIVAESADVAEAFFDAVCTWCSEVRGEILVFSGGCWHKSAELFQAVRSTGLDSLVLRGTLKEEIRRDFEQFLTAGETYQEYDVPWKRGVLFLGPPGNGKTHCAKALVNLLRLPCLYVQSFKGPHPYATEHASIQQVFRRARQSVPCLLVLEDVDALVTEENRAFFLNELDGFAENAGIITLATCNHPERLDPSILDRPSRFDMKYRFDLPGAEERLAYVALWNEKLGEIARLADGFSFAYLKELFLSSIMRWVAGRQPGTMPAIMAEQVAKLREQTGYEPEPPPPPGVQFDEADD